MKMTKAIDRVVRTLLHVVPTSIRGQVCLDIASFGHAIMRSKVCITLGGASAFSSIEFRTSSVAKRIPIYSHYYQVASSLKII